MPAIRSFTICLISFLCSSLAPIHGDKIPVVLDTDLGSDIDDTWALLYLLKSLELDLKMVFTDTTDTTDTMYRAKVSAKYLEVYERTDVAIGIRKPFEPDAEFQKPYIQGHELSGYPGVIHEDGIAAFTR